MARVILQHILSVLDYVLACLANSLTDNPLQLLASARVVGLHSGECLLVLLYACYYDCVLCHIQKTPAITVGVFFFPSLRSTNLNNN